MKYLLTIFGKRIIDVSKLEYLGEDEKNYMFCSVRKNGEKSKTIKYFNKKVIYRASDNIHDMFDGYALIEFGELESIYLKSDGWKYVQIEDCLHSESKIYGFILHKTGLLFVAEIDQTGIKLL